MEWFLKSIEVPREALEHLDVAELAFQRPTFLWGGLPLVAIAAWAMFVRQRAPWETVSVRVRLVLTVTRFALLAVLALVLAGPYLKIDAQVVRKPIMAVLLDGSSSMQLPAGPAPPSAVSRDPSPAAGPEREAPAPKSQRTAKLSRIDCARRAVVAAWCNPGGTVANRFDVRFFWFADRLLPRVVDPADPLRPLDLPQNARAINALSGETDRNVTRIGDAVKAVLEEAAGRQVAGIVLLSDGQNTAGHSPADVATEAAEAGTPILAVPVGTTHGPCDLAIVDIESPGSVAVGDTIAVHASLESWGFEGRSVRVELAEGDEVLDTCECVLHDSEPQHVELTFEAIEPGEQYLTVRVPPQREEAPLLHANNTESTLVRVDRSKIRLLFLDGRPRWDFRFLKNAIRRDHGVCGRTGPTPDVVVETEWRRIDPRQRASLPFGEFGDYDVIVLGDVSPQMLTEELQQRLSDAVRTTGVGLIVEAGTESMPHAYDDLFRSLLPVRCDPERPGREAPVYRAYRLEASQEGLVHETMRLSDEPGRNQELWRGMPPFYWCAAVDRPAPGAAILAWNANADGRFGRMPLIAYHYAGEGKVLFVGTDTTWLWRRNVGDRYFYKFWGQSIRFVARHDEDKHVSRIEIRPPRAQPGESATVELLAYHVDGLPVTDPSCEVRLVMPDGQQMLTLAADPTKAGRFSGRFTPDQSGVYRILYQPGGKVGSTEARLQVIPSQAELRHVAVNRPLLERMAKNSGGRIVEMGELSDIPRTLNGKAKQVRIQCDISVWDNWFMLLLFIGIYILDIGVRQYVGAS